MEKLSAEKKKKTTKSQSVVDPSPTYNTTDKEESEHQFLNLKAGLRPLMVEVFWVCYCHLGCPSSLPSPTDLSLFKERIHPLWEDSANCNGGKLIIRFKKAVSARFWEDLVLALVGDQLDYGDNECYAVY